MVEVHDEVSGRGMSSWRRRARTGLSYACRGSYGTCGRRRCSSKSSCCCRWTDPDRRFLALLLFLNAVITWLPMTVANARGIRIQSGRRFYRTYLWRDVADVRATPDGALLVLHDAKEVRIPGVRRPELVAEITRIAKGGSG